MEASALPEETTPPEGGDTYTPPASQRDLDKIVGERLAREREKYADYDELKAKASKFDEVEAASKSELQKLQDAVTERDAKLATLPREVRSQAIRFASTATSMGFLDPEDALVFVPDDVDLGDSDAVKAALTELAERKPHLVRTPKKPPVPDRPKSPKAKAGTDGDEEPSGKARAAAALRQMRDTH